MKKLAIIALLLTNVLMNAQQHGLLSRGFYVPNGLQEKVIEESECVEHTNDTSWVVSIPFENKNYEYRITNTANQSTFEELSKTKLHPNYKKILGIPAFFIAYACMFLLI